MNTQTLELHKMTVPEFLNLNASTQSYWDFWRFSKEDGPRDKWLDNPTAIESAERNLKLIYARIDAFESNPSVPKVGEWIEGYDGKRTRFTHAWDDGIQTGGGMGSFYLNVGGSASYSGGLDSSVPYDLIEVTDERQDGQFWIFNHGHSGAHRGVYYNHPCRVWKVKTITGIEQIKRLPFQYKVAEVTEDVYDYALGVVPPLHGNSKTGFFAMGEAYSHAGVVPVYYCFIRIGEKYYCTIAIVEEALTKFSQIIRG